MSVPAPQDPGFVSDAKRAASVWSGSWAVPVAYLLVALAYGGLVLLSPVPPEHCTRKVFGSCPVPRHVAIRSSALGLLFLPISLFHIGLSGTARVWYARRYAGSSMSPGEVWTLSWRFFGRFLLLGLLLLAVLAPAVLLGVVLLFQGHRTAFVFVSVLSAVLGDVLFTFATPGLALFNPSAWKSFTGGLRLLRTSWPECAAYALVPPMALTLLGRGFSRGLARPLTFVAAVSGPLLSLLFAGAAVSFMLRRYPPMSTDGTLPYAKPQRTTPYLG